MSNPWYSRDKHLRLLRDRLVKEGFTITDAWQGRHVRIEVERNGKRGTVTIAGTPKHGGDSAVNATMQKARRIDPK